MEVSFLVLECEICNKKFERSKSEYKRSQKLGRPSYCSRKCSGKANQKSLGEHLGVGKTENLNASNRRDELSPFKWYMRVVKRRKKERGKDFDIDLQYLNDLWETQKGICPFTGWHLDLPDHSSRWKQDSDKLKRASLDRIDNSKGYIKGNLRYVSIMANYCRNEFSDEEVKLFCEAVTNR